MRPQGYAVTRQSLGLTLSWYQLNFPQARHNPVEPRIKSAYFIFFTATGSITPQAEALMTAVTPPDCA